MCQDHTPPRPQLPGEEGQRAEFPWQLGAVDAHCHPTDTMASIVSVPTMRARVLTIMATRSQDQDLVAQVAARHSFSDRAALATPPTEGSAVTDKIVPAWGWHPWFSHQLYDDTSDGHSTYDGSLASTSEEEKANQQARHYTAVLSGNPDAAFIASLPEPKSLSSFLAETRRRLEEFPLALIGEIGFDKGFRLPVPWTEEEWANRNQGETPGARGNRALTKHHVEQDHQVMILKAQLRLAGQLGRAVSVHGVQGHGILFDALSSLWKGYEKEVLSRRQQRRIAPGAEDFSDFSSEESDREDIENRDVNSNKTENSQPYKPMPFPPRICLHSFSADDGWVKQYMRPQIPARIYFSFSTEVNLTGPTDAKTQALGEKFAQVIKACPDDRILLESDLHVAGEEIDYYLEHIYRKVCLIKGWTLEQGVRQTRKNYEEFIFG